ncbi:MAG: hypothetical protein IPL26_01945 [Leptospiraceae bacterium]|nr:hypothetical protein [Leptospiraceae bacterium]
MESNIFKEFASILSEVSYLLENNEFEILKLESEKNPRDYNFKWNLRFDSLARSSNQTVIRPTELDKNFSCKLCQRKLGAIRKFTHTGVKPILVLHYTSEFRKGQPALTKSNPNLTLRTRESEDLFDRLIKKVFGFSSKELHFQEYPACTFNHNSSSLEDWKERMKACDTHVRDTILTHGIKAVILMGSAAVLRFGADSAKQKTGIIESIYFEEVEIPSIVIRSPEGVFSLEEKRKKLESNKSSDAYKNAKKEEDEVKLSLVEHLAQMKTFIGVP